MPLDRGPPSERLRRELEEVARKAAALRDVLHRRQNFPLEKFPQKEVAALCDSLIELPGASGLGSRAPLATAEEQLPNIRYDYVALESDAGNSAIVVRGDPIDGMLGELITAVMTASAVVRREAGISIEEPPPEARFDASIFPAAAQAATASAEVVESIKQMRPPVEELRAAGVVPAETLARTLTDEIARSYAAEAVALSKSVPARVLRMLAVASRSVPSAIRKSADAIQKLADVAKRTHTAYGFLRKWLSDSRRELIDFLIQRTEKLSESLNNAADALEAKETKSPGAAPATFPIPEMVVIPAGFFLMGSPEGEWEPDEHPQHEVTFARPFAIGKYAVTVDEFAAFVAETGYDAGNAAYAWEGSNWNMTEGRNWRDPGFPQTGRHPVTCVSREDATAYAEWLSAKTGQPYRLPSEAEWEYAARGGTKGVYWSGNTISAKQANFDQNNKGTVPVDSYAANPFGLYNIHGNVWEWVADVWHHNYRGAPVDGSARTTGDGSRRVLRGGSWSDNPGVLRAAIRGRIFPDFRDSRSGFRLAKTLNP